MEKYKKIRILSGSAYLIVFFISWNFCEAQNVERKIIIQNGSYYYTTIDPEFQIATLHTGSISEPLNKARHYLLPAGRSLNEPVNPFSWDIVGSTLYAINFLDHPMNDRNHALKRFTLSTLHNSNHSSKDSVAFMLLKGVEKEPFALNDPYLFAIHRSPVLANFFFDGIAVNDTAYYMALANGGEFCLWRYNGKEWIQGKMQSYPVEGPFSLFVLKGALFMLSDKGEINKISSDQITPVQGRSLTNKLKDCILIINKDNQSISYIQSNDLNTAVVLKELMASKSILIF